MTKPELTEVHPTQELLTPDRLTVQVDAEMVPVVQAIWALDIPTLMCCQNVGEAIEGGGMWPIADSERWSTFLGGYAWLKMTVPDAQLLLGKLSTTPEFGPRLHAKAPGGWHSAVWLGPAGLADYANIYFPCEQIPALAANLTT
jgi:hypothetical protein